MLGALALCACLAAPPAGAQDDPFRATGLPVPRFVTIAASEANARAGPGHGYPVRWVFARRGEPVEVVREFDHWRQIRDRDGAGGWVHASLLSGRRGAIVVGAEPVVLRRGASGDARAVARVEPGARVRLEACGPAWCRVSAGGWGGWAPRGALWGVYPGEVWE
jgi:SH3-like domain-containing protein